MFAICWYLLLNSKVTQTNVNSDKTSQTLNVTLNSDETNVKSVVTKYERLPLDLLSIPKILSPEEKDLKHSMTLVHQFNEIHHKLMIHNTLKQFSKKTSDLNITKNQVSESVQHMMFESINANRRAISEHVWYHCNPNSNTWTILSARAAC